MRIRRRHRKPLTDKQQRARAAHMAAELRCGILAAGIREALVSPLDAEDYARIIDVILSDLSPAVSALGATEQAFDESLRTRTSTKPKKSARSKP